MPMESMLYLYNTRKADRLSYHNLLSIITYNMSSRESKYNLQNDTKERERLDLQHAYIKHGFNGNFAAPVDQILRSGARVLDIGWVG